MKNTQERKSNAPLFRNYRKKHGNLTQKQLAHRLGVSRSEEKKIGFPNRVPLEA